MHYGPLRVATISTTEFDCQAWALVYVLTPVYPDALRHAVGNVQARINIVMAFSSYGLFSRRLCGYGIYRYGLFSYGLYRCDLYSYGLFSYDLYSYDL